MIKKYYKIPNEILEKRWSGTISENQELREYVSKILTDIKVRGIEAILEYSKKFDGVELTPDNIQVSTQEIREAYNKVSKEQVNAIIESKKRLENVELKRLNRQNFTINLEGVEIKCTTRPLNRIGCYVPGGKRAYPSTLIMNVVPAKVAGVNEIVVCTPSSKEIDISPLTLVAADICEVDQIYKLGGIQAIAAMTFGPTPILGVEKIVGPGNIYVTEAKKQVSDKVAIDKPAGPSEILIIADKSADPWFISLDLISQAEHGSGGISGLLTTSKQVAIEVDQILGKLLREIPNNILVKQVLDRGGFIYIVESLEEAIDFTNKFAPEHIEILVKEPDRIAENIKNAGLILLGPYTPVSSTDYCMGVNHVLPTEGYAKINSGLTVLDFLKPVSVIKSSKKGLENIKDHVQILAKVEGLPNHHLALEARFR
jgi:histidinol dehydrogenase